MEQHTGDTLQKQSAAAAAAPLLKGDDRRVSSVVLGGSLGVCVCVCLHLSPPVLSLVPDFCARVNWFILGPSADPPLHPAAVTRCES